MLRNIIYATNQKLYFAQYVLRGDSCRMLKEKNIPLENGIIDPAIIKNFLQKERIFLSSAISCLFRHQAGVRFFIFPSSDPQEIARMVDFEAAELLPLKSEETITRHLVLNTRANGYSETLVVVTPKDEVSNLVEIYHKGGLEISAFNLSSLAIFNCVQKFVLEKKKANSKGNIIVIHFEDEAVEIIIVRNGKLGFSRGFLIDDAKNYHGVLTSEIRHSIDLFFKDTKDKNLEKIVLSGKSVDIQETAEVLKERFDIPVLIEQDISLSCGLALDNMLQVNLLSDEFIKSKAKEKFKKRLFFCVFLLIINVFICGALFLTVLSNKKKYLNMLEIRAAQLKPEAQSIQNKLKKLQIIQAQLNSQTLILDAITDLINLSSSCTLNMLSINEEKILVVRGQTNNLQDVLDFVFAIEKSSYFKNSNLNYSSRRKIKDVEITDFEIQAQLDQENAFSKE